MRKNCLILASACLFCLNLSGASAQDRIVFKNGIVAEGTVLDYRDGILRIIDQEGRVRSGSIELVESIAFGQTAVEPLAGASAPIRDESPTTTTTTTAAATDRGEERQAVMTVAEAVAQIESLEGQVVEVSGYVEKTERDAMQHDSFFVFLQGDMSARLNRNSFEDSYFQLKDLARSRQGIYSRPYFELRFANTGGIGLILNLVEKRYEYDSRRGRYRENTVGQRSILVSGELIGLRGRLMRRGNAVILDDAHLVAAQ